MNSIYISKPHFCDLDFYHLHYADILTYVAVKSFRNLSDMNCFPSYETIARRMGGSKSFAIRSVKRLINAGYIRKHKVAYLSNQYYFTEFDITDRVPLELLELDLSIYEKSALLIIRQFCVGVPHQTPYDISYMANKLGVSYKTLYTQIKSLVEKGFVKERTYRHSKGSLGFDISPKIDWWYEYDQPFAKINTENITEEFSNLSLIIC